MHVRPAPPPPPPHLLLHQQQPPPALCSPLTRQCSRGCHSRRSSSSIFLLAAVPSSSSAASITHKHPRSPKLHTPPLSHTPGSDISSACPGSSTAAVSLSQPPPHHHHHHHRFLSEAPSREKQASCLFFPQKCLFAGQLVFRCPCGG